MKDIIELVGAFSVLIASFAGLVAINKWKKERFEKVKIEALESYAICMENINDTMEVMVSQDHREVVRNAVELDVLEGRDRSQESNVKIFFEQKEKEIFLLGEKLIESNKLLRTYTGYGSDSIAFSYNYFSSFRQEMNLCLQWMLINRVKFRGCSEDDFTIYMFELLRDEKASVDFIDYMAVHSVLNLTIICGNSFGGMVDNRVEFDNKVLKILAEEKIRLHSMVFGKFWRALKIFLIKYYLAERVVLASESYAMVVGCSGDVRRLGLLGKGFKEFEKENRKGVFLKLLKHEVKSFFS